MKITNIGFIGGAGMGKAVCMQKATPLILINNQPPKPASNRLIDIISTDGCPNIIEELIKSGKF